MTTLFRPVGLHELSLVWDSGMRAFPLCLPHQPIFYPVANREYATQIARDWNANDSSFAGYVTKFSVDDSHLAHYEATQGRLGCTRRILDPRRTTISIRWRDPRNGQR